MGSRVIPDHALVINTDTARLAVTLHGGCILAYRLEDGTGGFDILRPPAGSGNGPPAPTDTASFPLVPYSNRISAGRFRFGGQDHRLPLNFGDGPNSIHGVGWQSRWNLRRQAGDEIVLDLRHDGDGWPFPFHASQRFTLDGAALHHELAVTNVSGRPMPAGLGLHPYFPRHRGARLTADVTHVWLTDEQCLPTERVSCPDQWNLRQDADVDALKCDNQFEPWRGPARIVWPADGVGVELDASDDLERLVVFAPDGADFFCVEPVSHMTDAFNHDLRGLSREEAGMRVLEDGETWRVWMRLTPAVL